MRLQKSARPLQSWGCCRERRKEAVVRVVVERERRNVDGRILDCMCCFLDDVESKG